MPHAPLTDLRRKRILYRATHRGTKESDAIVGGFFTVAAANLPDEKLDEADALLDEADLDLIDWVMGRTPIPERWRNSLFDEVLAYYGALVRKKDG